MPKHKERCKKVNKSGFDRSEWKKKDKELKKSLHLPGGEDEERGEEHSSQERDESH